MKMIINGQWADASDKTVINITDPSKNAVIDTVPDATIEDVETAVMYAKTAQKSWAKLSVYKKAEIIKKFLNLVDENKDDLATTLSKETGKPITEAYGEIGNVRIAFEAFTEKAKHLYSNVIPYGTEAGNDNTLQITMREPVGVVACIIPFNFPCDLFDQKVAPAILAGNTVIVKPPHQNPLTLVKLTDLLHRAGTPAGVVQILTGNGAKSGNALAKHPDVHAITFTGSTAVGIITYKNAADHLAHVALELGGNDAFIVLEDADIDLAVEEMVWGRMYNTGQVCCASKRFIVQESVKDQFVAKALDRLKQIKTGDPMDKDTQIGCLVTEDAAKTVEKQVQEVVSEGGEIKIGGKRDGAFYGPTLIDNVPKSAGVAKDVEIFGPVVPVISFKTVEEAIEIANASIYGLSGCVFTQDISKAMNVVSQLECGGTVINGASFFRSFEMPFGGYKMSGIGSEGVMSTFDAITRKKTIVMKNILK